MNKTNKETPNISNNGDESEIKVETNPPNDLKEKKTIQTHDRVAIDNLMDWDLSFRGIESQKDFVIPKSAKDWKQLTVDEVDAQVKSGNHFFCGTDGFGANAHIHIRDKKVREYIFGDSVGEQVILDLETVKKLLNVSPQSEFENELEKTVVTDAQKKMIVPLCKTAGIELKEAYKKTLIEKWSGYKFE